VNLRRSFDLVLLLVSWVLWKERNARVFDNRRCSAQQAMRALLEEADDWISAGFVAIAEFLIVAS
jgi:nicotinamide riboside kinase